MKKLILIIVLLFSTLFNGSFTSAATADYDHDRLLEYDGYAEAMYESIVEQTTFISGRYTENKDYVNESINQITDYAKGWWNEYKTISELPPKEKIREMINAAGGYALTVGDFIKNLFTDAEKVIEPPVTTNPLAGYFTHSSSFQNPGTIKTITGFYFNTIYNGKIDNGKRTSVGISFNRGFNSSTRTYDIGMTLNFDGWYSYDLPTKKYAVESEYLTEFWRIVNTGQKGVSGFLSILEENGVSIRMFEGSSSNTPIDIQKPSSNFRTINNYIQENSPSVVTPKPTAYLSCPDGTRINMKINGGTFLDVKGNIMSVDKNGTATIDSQICNLGWEKPKVQYIDKTDQIGVSTPDGDIIDAETGETITGGGGSEFDDEIEDGCGTLCAIGKLLTGIGQIAKSIAGLATKILDGLLALFVPDNLDFISEEFDKMSAKFTDKFSLLTGLKDTITGVFQSSDSGNLLSDVNMTLPAAQGFNFSLDTVTFIEPFVPRIKQIISGIVFLMTIIYVYRKITGRGGVMEK